MLRTSSRCLSALHLRANFFAQVLHVSSLRQWSLRKLAQQVSLCRVSIQTSLCKLSAKTYLLKSVCTSSRCKFLSSSFCRASSFSGQALGRFFGASAPWFLLRAGGQLRLDLQTTSPTRPFRGSQQPQQAPITTSATGCGSKLIRRGCAGVGPCLHLPGFHFGTGF